MIAAQVVEQAAFDNETLTRVERLLLQYPDVSESELAEIAHISREGTVIEISMLALNRNAWRNAEKLDCRLPRRYSTRSREYLAIRAMITAIIIALALSWVIAG